MVRPAVTTPTLSLEAGQSGNYPGVARVLLAWYRCCAVWTD